jgi:RimJ/RimL family protein N-acetyltransferase
MPDIETERLLLRRFRLEDADVVYRMGTDPQVTRYTHEHATSIEQAREILIEHPLADYQKHGFGRWACVLKATGEVIGFSGLKRLEDLGEVDVGYRFLPAYWGKGLATEAARVALDFGFTQLRLPRIIGLVIPENVASVRVLEKIGMTFVEIITYHEIQPAKYAIDAHRFASRVV